MKLFCILALLHSVVAAPPPALCKVESFVLSTLSKQPQATTFCSSFLGVRTVTTTSTTRSTTPAATATSTVTVSGNVSTVTASTTVTTTRTDTSTVTATDQMTNTGTVTVTSTSATAATCQSTATTYQAQVAPPPNTKRDAIEARGVPTPDCFRRRQRAFISTLCSCISIPTPTSTVTATSTVSTGTTTTTVTTATTPLTTVTSTSTSTTSTSTTVTSTTTLPPATETATATAFQPSQTAFPGLKYYYYRGSYDYTRPNSGFNPNDWKNNPNYYVSGLIQNLDVINSCKDPASGASIDCTHLVAVMQGFLYAPQAGTYTVAVADDIDNGFFAWSGSTAYSAWDSSNEAFNAERPYDTSKYHGGSASYNLRQGEFLPLTLIFVNGGGPAKVSFSITTPDGMSHSGGGGGYFVPPCDGSPFVV